MRRNLEAADPATDELWNYFEAVTDKCDLRLSTEVDEARHDVGICAETGNGREIPAMLLSSFIATY